MGKNLCFGNVSIHPANESGDYPFFACFAPSCITGVEYNHNNNNYRYKCNDLFASWGDTGGCMD